MPAFADQQPAPGSLLLSNTGLNHPGIKWDWNIRSGNYTFDVTTVSNYEMKKVTYDTSNKALIFTGNSSHTDNISEIEIPSNFIAGNLTVTQNGKPISPIILQGTNSSTIILEFNQTGITTTTVVGTIFLPEFSVLAPLVMAISIGIVLFTQKVRKL